MRPAFMALLLVASPPCLAQKWLDANGEIYYGMPPPGVYVTPAPMTRGATSTVGAQRQPVVPMSHHPGGFQPDDWLERVRQQHRLQQEATREMWRQQAADREAKEGARSRDEERRERESALSELRSHMRDVMEQERERAAERQSRSASIARRGK